MYIYKKQAWLLIFIFLIPFFPALNLGTGFDLASIRVLILLLFIAGVFWGLARGRLSVASGLLAWLLAGFLLWTLASFLFSPVLERTFRKAAVFFSILPLFWVVYGALRRGGWNLVEKMGKALAISGGVVALVGILQFLLQFLIGREAVFDLYTKGIGVFFWGKTVAETVQENPSWLFRAGSLDLMRSTAVLPDPHILSYFLAFALPLQAIFFWQNRGKTRIFWLALAAISLLAEFLTFSRGGYLGFVLAACFMLGLVLLKRRNVKESLIILGAGGVLFLAIFSWQNPVSERFFSSFDIYEGSNQGRLAIWREAWEIAREHPLRGVGLGAYSFEVKPAASYRDPIYPHNLYLEFLAEMGIVGLFLWLLLLSSALIRFVRIYGTVKETKKELLALALATSLVWFGVHSMFEQPIFSPVILPLLVTWLALAEFGGGKKKIITD